MSEEGTLASHIGAHLSENELFWTPKGGPGRSLRRSSGPRRRSGLHMDWQAAGTPAEARTRSHQAAVAIRRFSAEALSATAGHLLGVGDGVDRRAGVL